MLSGYGTGGNPVIVQQLNYMALHLKHILLLSLLFLLAGVPRVFAQQEDTTRTERDVEERLELQRDTRTLHTPYQINLSPDDLNRYQLRDKGTQYGFHRRLNHLGPEGYFFNEEEHFDPYGPEWERMINEQILAILKAEFGEKSELLTRISRIARFFTFGFFEPYEVPIVPRFEEDHQQREAPDRN